MSPALRIKGSPCTLATVLKVTHDQTLLTNEQAVKAILDAIGVPYLSGKSQEPPSGRSEPSDWSRRLHHNYLFRKWYTGCDVWVAANEKTGYLHRVVIDGLLDEKEARVVRSEFARRGAKLADVERVARDVVGTRERRKYQNNFQGALMDVRNYFKWQDGAVIESRGRFLPLDSFNFSTEDVALLRAVYERLPPTTFDPTGRHDADRLKVDPEVCPTCGSTGKAKRTSTAKTRSELRKRLGQFNRDYPAEVFNAWMQTRLRAGGFTVATELYADYRNWAAKHGDSMNERRASKDMLLTLNKWGRLMVAGPYTPHRRNRGKGYRVTLRRE